MPRVLVATSAEAPQRAWIDIDNPPQVQYLAPFVDAFRARGLEVLVTARDYGMTTQLLAQRGVAHHVVGARLGRARLRKLAGTASRAARLGLRAAKPGRPDFLLATSRSAALAARGMRIPSFMVLDYEHAELASFRLAGTTILHPDVIASDIFHRKGFPPRRVIPFEGIKEDISFAGRDIQATPAHDFAVGGDDLVRVLVRPPSETSHYHETGSRVLTDALLARLAAEPGIRVVLSPRDPGQAGLLASHTWMNPPVVLERPVEFVSLLKGVDWVVCAGGTMLREAAYVGVPAVSLFRSEMGAVDRWLESCGAVRIVERQEDLTAIRWADPPRGRAVPRRPGVLDGLADLILARAASGSRSAPGG